GGAEPSLVQLEVQASYAADLPERLHWYNTLLRRQHGLPVDSVALLLRREADGPAMSSELHLPGSRGRRSTVHYYDIIRVWRTPADVLLSGGIGTLPLALIADDAANRLPEMVREVEAKLDDKASPEEGNTVWAATYILSGLRYPIELI